MKKLASLLTDFCLPMKNMITEQNCPKNKKLAPYLLPNEGIL